MTPDMETKERLNRLIIIKDENEIIWYKVDRFHSAKRMGGH